MSEEKKIIPETDEIMSLSDDELEDISGGEDLSLSAIPIIYMKCAVNSRHAWPYGLDACPVCGSTEFIRTVVP